MTLLSDRCKANNKQTLEKSTKFRGKMRKWESRFIPHGFKYGDLKGLSHEAREKLNLVKPETIGQASRIPGVDPSDISILIIYIEKYMHMKSPEGQIVPRETSV